MLKEKAGILFCQHCKSLQKTNNTVVECWYNPLDDEKKYAFCAANEDAVESLVNLFKTEYPIMYKEEADEVGDFIRRGWISPEHFRIIVDKLTVIDKDTIKQLLEE